MSSIEKSHPYWHVRSVLEDEPNISSLYLSYYLYRPQTLLDQRSIFKVARSDFLRSSYAELILDRCPPGHEVALHSLVDCHDNTVRHLPMVDMATDDLGGLSEVNAFVQDSFFHGFVWFESGRSFHGYGSRFVTHQQWIELMGKLLLCNGKDSRPIVDPRWVGHRLLGGYAALRWTRNTKQYLAVPHRLQPRTVGIAREKVKRSKGIV
jgi:hypothetical protein